MSAPTIIVEQVGTERVTVIQEAPVSVVSIVTQGPQGPQGPPGDAGAGSAPVWGNITGTLSAQTDLQTELNAKANASALSGYQTLGGMSAYLTTAAAATGYQPLDSDLSAIAALAGTSGNLTKTGANTWALDTTSYLTTANAASTYQTQAGMSSYLTSAAAASGYQPLDSDLTAIAALSTNGLLRKTGGTWGMDSASYLTGNQSITLSGDASGTGTTAITVAIASFAGSAKGLVPVSAGGTTNYLRADGSWAAPPGGAGTNLSYTASSRLLASDTGTDVTLPLVTTGDAGLAPASGGGTTNFLRADGTWAAPPVGGSGVTIADDTATNATRYPTFTSATSGNVTTENVASTKLTFNPSTGVLAATGFSGSGASLTALPAGQLSGTVPSAVLGNSAVFIGSTSVALNRASANLALTGISSVTMPGATSGTVQLIPTAAAGTGTVLTLPATTGTVALTSQLPTVNNATLTLQMGVAAATNNTVTVGTGTGFTANASGNATYSLSVGPALTALATTMTGAGTGFLRKNGADTYSLDTATYLTGNQTITLSGDASGSGATAITVSIAAFAGSAKGLVPASAGGTTNYLRADGTWAAPPGGGATNLTYTASTRVIASDTGTDATLPLFTATEPGLTPLSGGGTTNFLRADGTWAEPPAGAGGATNLSYTAATRVIASDTGTDATLPLVSTTDAGLAPASGGGTTNFLRADGTWTAPPQGVTSVGLTVPTGLQVANSPVTGSGTLAVTYAAGYQGYTTTEATKLSGIATSATANSTDASLRDRATHTGTQAHTTITGLGSAATRNLSVGTTAPGSPATGDLWVDTN